MFRKFCSEEKFSSNSYGFRPNRSVENAIAAIYRLIQRSGLYYVVEFDVKGFFDNVDHSKLIRQLWSMNIRDKELLYVIRRGVQEAEREPEQIQKSDGDAGPERKTEGRKRMRKKYYHAATPETMEKIIADGVVKRGWDGCVYLCEKPQDAAKFVAIRGHDEVAVIEVILPANKVKESFDHSVQFFQCKAFMYEEDIKVRPNAEVVEYSFK